ncbi:ABC transporter substrate-binding protein [Solicola gregarius]|uniref:ABC transporter substrate-binding protein n=1 Tax=Solicola gregarius TaxID=2908642 RepID=A0AA46TLC9_9ACTN|nr:ABC transporter substrate-binding protein [Solicola gregarius]UYM07263.1 ABC transporter substrate-binding protein [Solicola gregarius]
MNAIAKYSAALAAAMLTVVMSGCGANPVGNADSSTVDVDENSDLVDQVPDEIRDRGKLVIATNAPYPPLEFFDDDNKTLIGFDIDMGEALGQVLGLEVEWKNVAFDAIIPGLDGGRYDIGIAGFGIESERLQAVNFVSYYLNGGGFLVSRDGDVRATDFEDSLCGLRVAVQKGTSQVERLERADKHCTGGGQDGVEILQIPDQNQVALTLTSGRSDAVVADLAQVEYVAKQAADQLCVSGLYFTPHSLAGIAIPKRWDGLDEVLQKAVQELIDNGEYERIANDWGVVEGAVDKSKTFTEPSQVSSAEKIFPRKPTEGCASDD